MKTTQPKVETEAKARRTYNRRSVKEYEDEGLAQAIEYFRKIGGTSRRDTANAHDFRSAIDALPATSELKATMADFWLCLTKGEARKRRNNSPPTNPFVRRGRDFIAEKQQIADWDVEWRGRDAARVFASSGSSQSRSVGDFLRTQSIWLTRNKAVVGNTEDIPTATLQLAMQEPEKLDIEWMTLEEALRRNWVAANERGVWVERFDHAMRAVVAEVTKLYLAQDQAEIAEMTYVPEDKDSGALDK